MKSRALLYVVQILTLILAPFLCFELTFSYLAALVTLLACVLMPPIFSILLLFSTTILAVLMSFVMPDFVTLYSFALSMSSLGSVAIYFIFFRKYSDNYIFSLPLSKHPSILINVFLLMAVLVFVGALAEKIPVFSAVSGGAALIGVMFFNWRHFPSTTLRWACANALLFLGIFIFSLIIGEITSRFVLDYETHQNKLLRYDPLTLFSLRCDYRGNIPYMTVDFESRRSVSVKTNSMGLREDYEIGQKKDDEYRILLLGDSFSFGLCLEKEERFDAVLEQYFKENTSAKIEIVNSAVSGFSPWQELAWLEGVGMQMEPDAILLQSFATNDVPDSYLKVDNGTIRTLPVYLEQSAHQFLRYTYYPHWQMKVDTFFNDHSFIYLGLRGVFGNHTLFIDTLNGIRFMPKLILPEVPFSAPRLFYTEVGLRKWNYKVQEAWDIYTSDLLKIVKVANENKLPIIVFDIPFPFVTDEYDQSTLAQYEPDKANRMVEAFFEENKLHHVPLLQHIRSHPEPNNLYYPANAHLSPDGVQFIAPLIAEKMHEVFGL